MNATPLASRLEGKRLGKWFVKTKRKKTEADNSGYWSTCYTVEDENGNIAFLKAYNYIYAFQTVNSADVLRFMTENFTYERDLLKFCSDHRMTRVVTAIDSEEYSEPGEIVPVPCLVFEIAQGNLNAHRSINNPNLTWKLKSFHSSLVGLSQLHRARIVHQDIKPSNILVFGNNISKISDLGSATQYNNDSYWCKDTHCGDLRYAPIELLYRYFSSDWDTRRLGADLFMMGGILTYLITDSNFISLMFAKIPDDFKAKNFGGSYKEAIPIIMKSYYETLEEISPLIPEVIRTNLITIISELSHPIPEKRGNPQNFNIVRHRQFSLDRYISIIDRLSKIISWAKL